MVFIIDANYVVLSLIICFGMQMSFYAVAAALKFDKVTDFAYSTNFILLAILTLVLNGVYSIRQIVVTCIVVLWGIRLAAYLLQRILKIGEDKRFDQMRNSPLLFLRFWLFQFLTIWVVSLPFVFLNAKGATLARLSLRWGDFLGWTLAILGLLIETIADQQKYAFRNDDANKGKWCAVGIWNWSRHPNYFGEFLVWIGVFIACTPSFVTYDYITIVSPIYLFVVVMFISGPTRLEESADKRYWKDPLYQKYKKRTSNLIPIPPVLYNGVPRVLKSIFCCDCGIYWNAPEGSSLTQDV